MVEKIIARNEAAPDMLASARKKQHPKVTLTPLQCAFADSVLWSGVELTVLVLVQPQHAEHLRLSLRPPSMSAALLALHDCMQPAALLGWSHQDMVACSLPPCTTAGSHSTHRPTLLTTFTNFGSQKLTLTNWDPTDCTPKPVHPTFAPGPPSSPRFVTPPLFWVSP